MELKIVSFKTAKALKEAGSPQFRTYFRYNDDGLIIYCDDFESFSNAICDAAFAMEVWLWLCREKKIKISAEIWHDKPNNWGSIIEGDTFYKELHGYNDPEEAIIAAIEYLVENDLIK